MNQRNRLPNGASRWDRSRREIKCAIPPEGCLGDDAECCCSRCGATVVADRADDIAEHRLLDSLYPIVEA